MKTATILLFPSQPAFENIPDQRGKKTLSKYSESQASIQTTLWKGVASFYTPRDFFHLEETTWVSESSTKYSCHPAAQVGVFQPHGHHGPHRTWDAVGQLDSKHQSSAGQLQYPSLPPSHPAWIPVHPVLWLRKIKKKNSL